MFFLVRNNAASHRFAFGVRLVGVTHVRFLVSGADLSAEEILIGLPVLRHIVVVTKTMHKRDRMPIDDWD